MGPQMPLSLASRNLPANEVVTAAEQERHSQGWEKESPAGKKLGEQEGKLKRS